MPPSNDKVAVVPAHSRRACLVATAALLAILFVPGAYHLRFGLRGSDLRRWGTWIRDKPAAEALREIDTDFDRRFLLTFVARSLTANAPALTPHSADTAQTVPGTDGFLFLNRDNFTCTSAGFLNPHFTRAAVAADQLIDLDRQCRRRGIHLLVLPVPPKAAIYPEHLYPGYDLTAGPFVNVDHGRWFARLRDAGVDVVDLVDLFWAHRYDPEGLTYYKIDSHWTDYAKRLAAEGPVADHLRAVVAGLPPAPPLHTRVVTRTFEGNLVLLGNRGRRGRAFDEDVVREQVVQVCRADDTPFIAGDEAPILIIGDSTADQGVHAGYGLAQRVMGVLGIPVQSAAVGGTDANAHRRVLANRPDLLRGKRVVIFCFSMHHLLLHDWEPVTIPGP